MKKECKCGKLIKLTSKNCVSCTNKINGILKRGKQNTHKEGCTCVICKPLSGINNPFYGKVHSTETREKISSSKQGKKLNHKQNCSCGVCKAKRGEYNGKNNPCYGKKHSEEARKKMSLTRGGTGVPHENNYYPDEFFRVKPKIRKRDNYTCQECNKVFGKSEKGLDVHHIDYDKQNCKEENLICLCHKCNLQANFNRTFWTNKYRRNNERKESKSTEEESL